MRSVTKKLAMALLVGATALAGMGISASAAKKNSVTITTQPANIKLAIGECGKLKKSATLKSTGKKVSNQKWKFSSQDKDIARVSRNGNIVGLKGGTARIRVRAAGQNTVKTIKVTVDGDALYVCKTSLAKFINMGIATQEEDTLNYTIKDQTYKTLKFSTRTLTDTNITLDNVTATNTYIESDKSYWINARKSNVGKVQFVAAGAAATTDFGNSSTGTTVASSVRPVLEIGTWDPVTSVKYKANGLVILDPNTTGGTVEVDTEAGKAINAGIEGGKNINVAVNGGEEAKTTIDLKNSTVSDLDINGAKSQTVNIIGASGSTSANVTNIKVDKDAADTKIVIGSGVIVDKVESAATGTKVENASGDVKDVPQNGSVSNPNGTTGGGGGGAVSYETYSISHDFVSTVGDVKVTFANAGTATFKRTALDELLAKVIASGLPQTITSDEGISVSFASDATISAPSAGSAINVSDITATVTKDDTTIGKYKLSVSGTFGKQYKVTADWSENKSSQKITKVEEIKK